MGPNAKRIAYPSITRWIFGLAIIVFVISAVGKHGYEKVFWKIENSLNLKNKIENKSLEKEILTNWSVFYCFFQYVSFFKNVFSIFSKTISGRPRGRRF